jgi:hypothetical protein
MRIDSSGNVGIGSSDPAGFSSRLLVAGGRLTMAGGNRIGFWDSSNLGRVEINSPALHTMAFYTADGATERMRIDSSGRVGIGTSSPSFTLDVRAATSVISAVSTTGTNAAYMFVNNTGGDFYLGRDNSAGSTFGGGAYSANIYSAGAYPMVFWTNASERMRIDSSGNLLVGKTATGISTVGTIITNGGEAQITRDGAAPFLLNRLTNDGSIAGFRRSGTEVGTISVTTTATAYNTSSDYRLKENVAPMVGALDKVLLLKPCIYTWKADGSDGQGFIAHELAEVVPNCVTGEKDAVDEEGNIKPQGVDTSFLVATLTAALQEAHGLIKDLQARVDALESK